ncbi:MAG TPA: hypothetical protein P5096_02220 [Patescibacteria group bacterium]|nr:hypothetical protein [Patescibacteria group bacterium]
MSDLSKNVLEEIKEHHITPKPKWEFLVRDYVIWAMFGILVLIGSIAFSALIFMITNHDWDIYRNLGQSFWQFLLLSLPYFWIVLVIAFSIFAWYDLKKTRAGYRYTFTKIGLANIGLSILLGTAFFYSGIGMKIENIFADNMPFYRVIHPGRGITVWENPDKGLLVGEVTGFIDDEGFNLRDLKNQDWIVSALNSVWPREVKSNIGMIVRIIGKQTGKDTFQAIEVRPWMVNCDRNGAPAVQPCRSLDRERKPFIPFPLIPMPAK